VRITISHNRSKQDVIQSVDRAFSEMFQGVAGVPIRLVVQQKNWQGSTLNFSLSARMGLISSPIAGTIEVTDSDLTIDADLGLLGRFIPTDTVREAIGSRIKGLLK
jgi:Putative polyhydroxyalkanoic acid system protein (PHA_gran_rgn)